MTPYLGCHIFQTPISVWQCGQRNGSRPLLCLAQMYLLVSKSGQALSHGKRSAPPVEGGRPRSRDGALLCPAQFPGAPAPLAAQDFIGMNSKAEEMPIAA